MTEFGEITVPGVFFMVPGGADGSVLGSLKRTNINKVVLFGSTGEPWGYTRRSGVMVRKAFPPFPTK